MTKEQYLDFCRGILGAEADQPFDMDFDTWVLRHIDSRKWFGIIMLHNGRWLVNLKVDPMEGEFLKKAFSGILPAYHMNKVHWISVELESDVPQEELMRLTLNSFSLTDKKTKRAKTAKER